VRHWLRGGVEDEGERIGDLVRFGVSEEDARAFVDAQGEPAPAVFGVWAENVEALTVFLKLRLQWRLHPITGAPVGLDHGAVPATLKLMGIGKKRRLRLFDRLMLCQDVALAALKARG